MEIKYMDLQDHIKIQDARIVNQNYSISWLAAVYHQDILVCLKSSWMKYDDFVEKLQMNGEEKEYLDPDICWQKVARQTSAQILTNKIRTPVDVLLLPVRKNIIYIPPNEEVCRNIQRTIKGIIRYRRKKTKRLFCVIEELFFPNDSMPVSRDTVIAEYIIADLRYPITVGMMGQAIEVYHPGNLNLNICATREFGEKYNLIVSEE